LGPDQREPNPSLWETPTWKALEFRVVEPSYYAYQYESAGHGYDARAAASAFGDVNGDGELEAFARHVTVEPGNEIRGGAGLFQYDSGTDRRSFLPESTGEDHPPFPVRTNTGSVAESEFQTQRGVQSFEVRGGAGLYQQNELNGSYASANRENYEAYPPTHRERATEDRLVTFSIDVDTASYTLARDSLMERSELPAPASVRVEEFLNFFDYGYEAPLPDDPVPFSIEVESAPAPFASNTELVRVAVQGARVSEHDERPMNLVFLVDVSGSMNSDDKLPLVQYGLRRLVEELNPDDSVGLVVYAGNAGVVLEPTEARDSEAINEAIDRLRAGGSTHGSAGIQAAYNLAAEVFREDGINRVIWCSDGDFNVGVTGDRLIELVERYREMGIYLTTMGYGRGNYNDRDMEQIANRGNGNYYYIDSRTEANRVMGHGLQSTIGVIATDMKIQLEVNEEVVERYRLIGYDNRALEDHEFRDDSVDAGEVGPGQSVTALLEIELEPWVTPGRGRTRVLDVNIRFEDRYGEIVEVTEPFTTRQMTPEFEEASDDLQFASAVAELAEVLKGSPYSDGYRFDRIRRIARGAIDRRSPEQVEFLQLVDRAQTLHEATL